MCIFLSHMVLFEAPSERPKSLVISKRRKRLTVKNYVDNFSLWAFFFFSIWLGFLVFLRELQREPGETNICTKRIRNVSSIRKLVTTIIHHLKCKKSRNKNNRKPSSIFFVLLFLCKKNPTIQISNPEISHKGGTIVLYIEVILTFLFSQFLGY